MDPITHTLTGLALARAGGLKRLTVHATPIAMLAANAPDVDLVTMAGGSLSYLHYHRHLTHAFVTAPLLALLPVVLVRLFARKPFDWKWAYVVSLLAVLTHPLLDWMNVYGIRFLLPFSGEWCRLDIVSLGDVWIWAVLLLAAAAPFLSRLVSSEIGARPSSGRGIAIAALLFLPLYAFGRSLLHERALAVLDSRLYDGSAPVRVAAIPGAFSPFRWTGLVETGPMYALFDLNLLAQFDPADGRFLYKPEMGAREKAAAEAALRTDAFRIFLDFSQYPYWRFVPADKPEDAIRVEVVDLRFYNPAHPSFRATALVDRDGRVLESSFSFGRARK